MRLLIGLGGGAAFVASLIYFALRYGSGFDETPPAGADVLSATIINVLLFSGFALHHSVFARTGLKDWISTMIPAALERSAYVWIASVLFVAACAFWQPVPGVLWQTSGPMAWILRGAQLVGVVLTLGAARSLDVLELAGIRQAQERPERPPGEVTLDDRGPYGLVRHPIYLGWLLLVWPAPFMNGTRLVFAATSTLYLLIAIPFEERDLRRTFGEAYKRYAERVKFKMVPWVY